MPESLQSSISGFESTIECRRQELSEIWSSKENTIDEDAIATAVAIKAALVTLKMLVKCLQKTDQSLIKCDESWEVTRKFLKLMKSWKPIERRTNEGKLKVFRLIDEVESSWENASEAADLALNHALNLTLEVSKFYGSKIVSLERDLTKVVKEIQRAIRHTDESIEEIRLLKCGASEQLDVEKERLNELAAEMAKVEAGREKNRQVDLFILYTPVVSS